MRTTRARESRLMKNITEGHRELVSWIIEAVKREGLALLEVTENATGKPAVLLVAVDKEVEGGGARMAPLARLDINMNDYTPPEGVEQVAKDEEPKQWCEEDEECEGVGVGLEEDEGVDITGVGC